MAVAGSYGASKYGSGKYGITDSGSVDTSVKKAVSFVKKKYFNIGK